MEYKQMRFKANAVAEEEGVFEGYGSIFGNVDNGGDIVDPGAFEKTLEKNKGRIKILALHNDSMLPIGVPLEMKEDEKGLYLKAKISDTSLGQDVKVLLKDGVLNELSIGYDTIQEAFDEDGNRHLKEVDLWEVSVVTWAMNQEATISGYKARSDPTEQVGKWVSRLAAERKEGRKISGARLTALQEASTALKGAVKALDALIQDAQGEEPKTRKSPEYRKKQETIFEIII